jgi:hypothetical protein
VVTVFVHFCGNIQAQESDYSLVTVFVSCSELHDAVEARKAQNPLPGFRGWKAHLRELIEVHKKRDLNIHVGHAATGIVVDSIR